jgi:hypothetical protein
MSASRAEPKHIADDLSVPAVELWPLQLWVEIEGARVCQLL